MIGIDTNLLVYAHRREMPHHATAFALLRQLAEGRETFAITWASVHEFLRIVTDPRIFKSPTPTASAFAQIEAWLASPSAIVLGETATHLTALRDLAIPSHCRGAKIHDARIAAICLQHGTSELLTADRDFSSFPQMKTRNPLLMRVQ